MAIDVAVVGLGAMGSAALYHLARRGMKCLGVDAFAPPHTRGSTHGRSRIIREAYFEHPSYVPLVRRAYDNWAALEQATGRKLLQRTGGLMIGRAKSGVVMGTMASARAHDIAVEMLDAEAIQRRIPALSLDAGMVGVLEVNAGVLDPEACVQAHLDLARSLGATVHLNQRVAALEPTAGHVRICLADQTITARSVVVCAGAWTGGLLRDLGPLPQLVVERQTMHWFTPPSHTSAFDAGVFPVTLIEYEPDRYVYYIPDLGHGVKAAVHYEGAYVDADAVQRQVTDADIQPVSRLVKRFTPALPELPTGSAVCVYTNTPDKHFIVDAMPGAPNVFVMSACSGHGFKFASALGEVAAAAAAGEASPLDLHPFRCARFT